MLNVANIIEDARMGGPQYRIIRIAKSMKSRKFNTIVFVPKLNNRAFIDALDQAEVAYITVPLSRLTKEKKYLFLYFIGFFYEIALLRRVFKKNNIAIVHNSGGSWQWKGVIAGKLAGCKVVWHLNDTQMPRLIRKIFDQLVRFADAFIVASDRVKAYYLDAHQAIGDNKIQLIPAPVDCQWFDPRIVRADKRLQSFSDKKIITVGSVSPVKGLELFIAMASIVSAHLGHCQFYIVGPVHSSQYLYAAHLKRLIQDSGLRNIHFLGATEDTRPILKASDVYVCSSVAEASPTAVWEAMAMQLPVVSTDVGDIDKQFSGVLSIIKSRSAAALAKAVLTYLCAEEGAKVAGQAAREAIAGYAALNICAKRHETVYAEVSGHKKVIKGEV